MEYVRFSEEMTHMRRLSRSLVLRKPLGMSRYVGSSSYELNVSDVACLCLEISVDSSLIQKPPFNHVICIIVDV